MIASVPQSSLLHALADKISLWRLILNGCSVRIRRYFEIRTKDYCTYLFPPTVKMAVVTGRYWLHWPQPLNDVVVDLKYPLR